MFFLLLPAVVVYLDCISFTQLVSNCLSSTPRPRLNGCELRDERKRSRSTLGAKSVSEVGVLWLLTCVVDSTAGPRFVRSNLLTLVEPSTQKSIWFVLLCLRLAPPELVALASGKLIVSFFFFRATGRTLCLHASVVQIVPYQRPACVFACPRRY